MLQRSPFRVVQPSAPPCERVPVPYEVRVGDDWTFGFDITDDQGRAIDLTGSTVTAALYIGNNPTGIPIEGANGSLTVDDAVGGRVSGVVARALTRTVSPQQATTRSYSVRLAVTQTDALGRQHTFEPKPLLPLARDDLSTTPVQPHRIMLQWSGEQGPAGPGLNTSQVNALISTALAVFQSQIDDLQSQIDALPNGASPSGTLDFTNAANSNLLVLLA